MADVDPVSGMPRETVDSKVNINRFNRLDAQKIRHDQLLDDLTSDKGHIFINLIKELALARIDKVMADDGEYSGYKKILVGMGVTINMGEMAVDKLMKMVTKRGG